MKVSMLSVFSRFYVSLLCALGLLVAGCNTGKTQSNGEKTVVENHPLVSDPSTNDIPVGADILRPGDRVRVVYNDIPDKVEPAELQVPEGDGVLTLYLGVEAKFAGKKVTQLEREITAAYVEDKKLFRRITVNIERIGQTVSVGGEVREAGNINWVAGMTVTSAINAAKGMTDYAAKERVLLTRSTKVLVKVNVKKALEDPSQDLKVYPGDKIEVPRRSIGVLGL